MTVDQALMDKEAAVQRFGMGSQQYRDAEAAYWLAVDDDRRAPNDTEPLTLITEEPSP